MLSKKCVPIATTLLSFPSTEVTPLPIVVSFINKGYPTANLLAFDLCEVKKNLSALVPAPPEPVSYTHLTLPTICSV